jgi:HsdM-like protein
MRPVSLHATNILPSQCPDSPLPLHRSVETLFVIRTVNSSLQRGPACSHRCGFEAQLWQEVDALRGTMDAVEYKHVALDLIFLKHL